MFCAVFIFGCAISAGQSKDKAGVFPGGLEKAGARTAVGAVADVVSLKGARAKYCPLCGRRYGPGLVSCPKDNAELKEVEE